MCGIVGVVTGSNDRPQVGPGVLERMRDRLAHRGPDDAGLLVAGNIAFAQTRLAILDPSPAGHQPMQTPDSTGKLVYNGEIYNDNDLRKGMDTTPFLSTCDTETVMHLLAARGERALEAMRGMFALAFHDRKSQTLVLARDPLGIKPLYYWRGTIGGCPHLIFASEPSAILEHPGVSARPDLAAISGYLTTIRTAQGNKTLFEGIHALSPGEWIVFDLRDSAMRERRGMIPVSDPPAFEPGEAAQVVREAIEDSVRRHLRADVPMCSLLSGGLDSTIIASVARTGDAGLMTYCAGSPTPGVEDDDLAVARVVAHELSLGHAQVPITRDLFLERWPEMVARLGVPLSTPNEVAINEVARNLARDGFKVALSGEGADELFAGYDGPLGGTRQFLLEHPDATTRQRAVYELEANGWVAPSVKGGLLREPIAAALGGDDELIAWQEAELERCNALASKFAHDHESAVDMQLSAHLLLQQRVNLAGLLGRLDTAMMLASVEGRTPLADAAIARLANGLPMDQKIVWNGQSAATKIALRNAFENDIPQVALTRPKASFPLPFMGWMDAMVGVLPQSDLLGELFAPGVVEAVAQSPAELWRLAWPMLNIALWEEHWWGNEKRPGTGPGDRSCASISEAGISGDDASQPDHQAREAQANSVTE
jgi:asparagine synthase (glutamine-hydrolysing)